MPGAFILLLTLGAIVLAVLFFIKPPLRSRLGDRALANIRQEKAALKTITGRPMNELTDADLLMAVGLFGTTILAGGPFARIA